MLKLKDFIPPFLLIAKRYISGKIKNEAKKYEACEDDYNMQKYWDDRHAKAGFNSLKGVGVFGHSEAENFASYKSAEYIFLGMLKELNINKEKAKIFEIGFGNGYYAKILANKGFINYSGIDISEINISQLNKKIPSFAGRFNKIDAGAKYFKYENCDLIFMIDVSQHIINTNKLIYCLRNNVKRNLKKNGVFIVTDELSNKKKTFYETTRTIEFYKKALGLALFQKPICFRDKYIFSFK